MQDPVTFINLSTDVHYCYQIYSPAFLASTDLRSFGIDMRCAQISFSRAKSTGMTYVAAEGLACFDRSTIKNVKCAVPHINK
jgi:hypothetical protein